MTDQVYCVGVLIVCLAALAHITSPRPLHAWGAYGLAALGLASLALAVLATGCTRPTVRSPLVQVAEWRAGSARPEPAHCSGFAVRTDEGVRVLTAAHCMTAYNHGVGDRVAIVTLDRWSHTSDGVRWARVLGLDLAADVAVLEPEAAALAELDPYPLADRDPVPGEHMGVQSGWAWGQSAGRVQGLYYTDTLDTGAHERWAAGATVEPGWSGSAVIDSRGQVLGLVTSCQALPTAAGVKLCRPGFAAFEALH